MKPLNAYTSVSTALNQWLWVNAKVKEAVKEDHILKNLFSLLGSNLSINWLQIKKRRLIVSALMIGEKIFTLNAISLLRGIKLKNLPTNKNNGLPGGWGTPKIWEVAINSPVSQNDTVGAIVEK